MTTSGPTRKRAFLEIVDSTNKEAARRHGAGEPGPIWIAAKRQSEGRGRAGRHWHSASGNLAATFLFPFSGGTAVAPSLGFVAALAVCDTIQFCAPGADTRLKWPNDVLLENKKVSGILLESFGPSSDGKLAVAIGIGINLVAHPGPTETRWPATCIRSIAGLAPSPATVLDKLDCSLNRWLDVLSTKGFDEIRQAWKGRAAHLGKEVTVRGAEGDRTGCFLDLDADGALLLETVNGVEAFAAGDVTLGETSLAACD